MTASVLRAPTGLELAWRKHVPPGAVAFLFVEEPPRRAIIHARTVY